MKTDEQAMTMRQDALPAKGMRLVLSNLPRSKPPIIERRDGGWFIWTSYNPALTMGTYFKLCDDGHTHRVTINPDGTIDLATISDPVINTVTTDKE